MGGKSSKKSKNEDLKHEVEKLNSEKNKYELKIQNLIEDYENKLKETENELKEENENLQNDLNDLNQLFKKFSFSFQVPIDDFLLKNKKTSFLLEDALQGMM